MIIDRNSKDRFFRASDKFYHAAAAAEATGNFGVARDMKDASNALLDFGLRAERKRVEYDVDEILGYSPSFESVWWPRYSREWDGSWFRWITSRWTWGDVNTSPSICNCMHRIAYNVKVVLLWYMSPWFRMRYRFILTFVNFNGCKLLDSGINWALVRNRVEDCAYYTMSFSGFRYTLYRKKLLKDGETGGQNMFIQGIITAFSEDGDRGKFHEVTEKVCSGWVFGWRSFVREMNRVVEKTPDLEWYY